MPGERRTYRMDGHEQSMRYGRWAGRVIASAADMYILRDVSFRAAVPANVTAFDDYGAE